MFANSSFSSFPSGLSPFSFFHKFFLFLILLNLDYSLSRLHIFRPSPSLFFSHRPIFLSLFPFYISPSFTFLLLPFPSPFSFLHPPPIFPAGQTKGFGYKLLVSRGLTVRLHSTGSLSCGIIRISSFSPTVYHIRFCLSV